MFLRRDPLPAFSTTSWERRLGTKIGCHFVCIRPNVPVVMNRIRRDSNGWDGRGAAGMEAGDAVRPERGGLSCLSCTEAPYCGCNLISDFSCPVAILVARLIRG